LEILLDHIHLHRGGRAVLRDICWHVSTGQRWLIVGASGAGKTQLMKVLAGDVWPDAGRGVRRYGIDGEWHEQPADVRDEIAWLGPERQDRYERYAWNHRAIDVVGTGIHRTDIPLQRLSADEQRAAMRLLRRTGIAGLAQRRFLTLSYGERRLVLLARVMAWRARLLLLDEVATGLDDDNRARLFRVLGGPGARSVGWVCSAHRAEDVPPGATHLMWLEAGAIRHAGTLTAARLRQAVAAARADAHPRRAKAGTAPRRVSPKTSPRRPASRPVIRLQQADVWIDGRHVLHGIELEVRRGQCWVLHGANGSGKSTLLRTIYGDHAVASDGVIWREGIEPGVPLDEFRSRTGLVAPHLQTDYPRQLPVLDTVVSGLHSSIGLNFAATATEKARARQALRALDMEEFAARSLADMSYGQVRRILFARAMVIRPRLLLLDEAFTGLDPSTRQDLLGWLEGRIAAGTTVVMATHYRREWPRNATHELMLSRGRVSYAGKLRR
jgi:molybdate transport system ATP-binding protein